MKLVKPLLGLLAGFALMRLAKSPSASSASLDPDMQKILDKLATLGGKPIERLSPAEARQQPLPGDAVKALLASDLDATTPGADVSVSHQHITGPLGDIPIHVYTPAGEGPFPLVLYFHGGGFVIASTADYDASARALAATAQSIVVAVDYHQAPEHKFPAAPEDAYAALLWVCEHAHEINGDARLVAVAGESAGGNLATVVSMMARDRNIGLPLHQLLIYPVVDNDMTRPSYRDNANAKPLNKAMMAWFFQHYATPADAMNPYALPIKAGSLSGLPPATVITAEIDPLRSEGQAYAEKLQAAGVPATHRDFKGVTHEFFGLGAALPLARDAQRFAGECLKEAFNQERARPAPCARSRSCRRGAGTRRLRGSRLPPCSKGGKPASGRCGGCGRSASPSGWGSTASRS